MPVAPQKPTRKLECLRRMDRRTTTAKQIEALAESFASELGGWDSLTDVKRREIERAAVLTAMAGVATERFLRGHDGVTNNDVVRAENLAARAVRRLGLSKAKEPKPKSIAEYLREKGAGAQLVKHLSPRSPEEVPQ